jgi:hypothetical protein
MPTTTELLIANLHEVFGAADSEERHRAAVAIFAPDVVFADPEGTVIGIEMVEAKAAELADSTPAGFRFVEDGPVYAGKDSGALAWALGPEGADPVVRGIDVVTVYEGRITSLTTLIADAPPAD